MSDFDEKAGELHEWFDEVLAEADCEITASEFQGVLSGMISAGLNIEDLQWKTAILDVVNNGKALKIEAQKAVEEVLLQSYSAFKEEDFLAPILIPADNYPLIDRVEAMALWCQGYLLGFGLQIANKKISSSEVRESLLDISEISQMEVSSDDDEDAQNAIETLLEHLKVAVKVIYLDLVVKPVMTEIKPSAENTTYH